ncbi:MAG: tetratricopeptide repeat protein [Nitrospirae bacterium]|nr:tetratricopeptide repeat protein [Nitrospirota bacterium]MBI3351978.1 tetratricopeptide repeat protein [Nitrospirota bacterium]
MKKRDVARYVSAMAFLAVFILFPAGCTHKVQAQLKEAERQFRLGNYQDSRSDYLQIAETYPKSRQAPEAYYWAGVISYLYLKQTQKALDYFHKVLTDYPASEFVLPSRGHLAEMFEKEFNEPRLAIGEYQKMIEETPDHANEDEYLYKIGDIYFNQGDLAQSKIEWEGLIKKFPRNKWTDRASFQVAMILLIKEKYAEGLAAMDDFLKVYPDSPFVIEAKYERGVCLEELNRYDEALAVFKELLPTYSNHLLIEARIKKIEEKKSSLQQQESVEPDRPTVHGG